MFFRTDLALEEQEALRQPAGECRTHERDGCRITRMTLRGEQARRLNKPEGRYITVELPPISDHIDGEERY